MEVSNFNILDPLLVVLLKKASPLQLPLQRVHKKSGGSRSDTHTHLPRQYWGSHVGVGMIAVAAVGLNRGGRGAVGGQRS